MLYRLLVFASTAMAAACGSSPSTERVKQENSAQSFTAQITGGLPIPFSGPPSDGPIVGYARSSGNVTYSTGDTIYVPVSAETGAKLDEALDGINVAQLQNLYVGPDGERASSGDKPITKFYFVSTKMTRIVQVDVWDSTSLPQHLAYLYDFFGDFSPPK